MTEQLFQILNTLIPTLHGWCSVQKAHILASSVIALRPATSVEIGVWGGRSFFAMALAHKETGQGVVYGIDPWAASASVEGQLNEKDREYWGNQANHDLVYADFMRQVDKLQLNGVVQIVRARSDDFTPPPTIDLLHLDGNHGEQVLKDVERYASKVRTGGLCFMDDLGWTGGAVTRGVARLHQIGFTKLYDLDTGAMFQRV